MKWREFGGIDSRWRLGLLAALSALIAGCGGAATDASIGGTVAGLGSGLSVTLQDNGTDSLAVASNGSFAFHTQLATGATYSVGVLTQPVGQNCTVVNGSGTVDAVNNVTDIVVTCSASASIIGTVSGLAAGTSVTLSNGTVQLPIAVNGPFAFPGVIAVGAPYAVTVLTQPAGQACSLQNASGTIPASGIASVTVTCN